MKSSLFVVLLLLGATVVIQAQDRPPRDPIGATFFPPELLMEAQTALNLTEAQKTKIKDEIHKAQEKFTDAQWQLKKETESMADLLRADRVDEQQAIAQLEKVMGLEREIKKTQVTLMVRIKNTLSPEQQLLLYKFKQEREDRDRDKFDRQRLDRYNDVH
jgi:Spy/CpxP family protein refolding chaperone